MRVAEGGTRDQLRWALALAVGPERRAYGVGLVASLLLAVPDLGRQLLVRNDPSYPHALLVDVIGVLSAAFVQVTLVGAVVRVPGRRWFPSGVGLVLAGVRERPLVLLAGLVVAGAVSAGLTLPVSIAVLGVRQVIGPLHGPAIWSLVVAGVSDTVATAVTAPYWAVLVACGPARGTPGQRSR